MQKEFDAFEQKEEEDAAVDAEMRKERGKEICPEGRKKNTAPFLGRRNYNNTKRSESPLLMCQKSSFFLSLSPF